MRGLTVVAGCNDYMDNRLEEVKRQEVRAASAFGPLLAISRIRHRLEGMAFAFSENRTEGTFHDPAHVETLSLGRLRFLAPMIMGRKSQEEPGKKKIYPASVHPPLTPEQVRAMLAARDLPEGPVVKQLLEWIAELENRQSEKK